jgi:ribosomal protein L37AE/L43A
MAIEDKELLERLNSGVYDGCCNSHDGFNGGSPWGIKIENGIPVKYKNVSHKYFDGKENIRTTNINNELFKSDKKKLFFLKYYGYDNAFSEFPEIREAAEAYRQELKENSLSSNSKADLQIGLKEKQPLTHAVDKNMYRRDYTLDDIDNNTDSSKINGAAIAGIVVAVAALGYVVYKTAPHIKDWLTDSALPGAKRFIGKITNKEVAIEKTNSNKEKKIKHKRFPHVTWFCDECGARLNLQKGFNDENNIWKCTRCGFNNSISYDNIFHSEEEYQKHLKEKEAIRRQILQKAPTPPST